MKITKSQLESIIREELETVKEEDFTDPDIAGGDKYEGLDKVKYMLGLLLAKMSSDPNTTRYADQLDKILVMMQGAGVSEELETVKENYQEYRKEYEALKPHVIEALGYSGSHYVALALEALMHDVKDDVLKGKDWNKEREAQGEGL